MGETAVGIDRQLAGLVDKRAQRERGIATVHHHTHALDGFCGAPAGGAPP